ncbi:Predicted PurR-regulated permease PerM [Lachnospiraceae bacterium C10]|jgi:predicted PurR-regulated permease PerM|nr:Predicted PurR-regulated permease PerM [Lachnospiraceae bacterium C10]
MLTILRKKIDPKYFKVCLYAAVTVIATLIALLLIYMSGSIWAKIWNLFTAILKPLIIGFVFSYLLSPAVSFFEKKINHRKTHAWARGLSVLICFLLIFAFIALFLVLISLTVYKSVTELNIESIKASITAAINFLNLNFTDLLRNAQSLLDKAGIAIHNASDIASYIISAVSSFTTSLLFGIIFSIYFLLDGHNIFHYWEKVFHVFANDKAKAKLSELGADADRVFSGYLRGQVLDALVCMILTTIILLVVGAPNAILVGLMVGFGNLIPYMGPIFGYATMAIVCLPSGNIQKLVIGIICIAIIMFVDGNIINPKLLSDNVSVHPLLVVAALIGGGAIGGLLGMLLAVPVAAFLKLQLDKVIDAHDVKQ